MIVRLAFSLLLLAAALPAIAAAAEPSACAAGVIVLWGDGRHDDTAALNAWFRGEAVIWAQNHAEVGPVIAGHSFLLSQAVYAPGGTGRTLEQFRMVWPRRREIVTGDMLATGTDKKAAPTQVGVRIVGGDKDEGVAFQAPDPVPPKRGDPSHCLIS